MAHDIFTKRYDSIAKLYDDLTKLKRHGVFTSGRPSQNRDRARLEPNLETAFVLTRIVSFSGTPFNSTYQLNISLHRHPSENFHSKVMSHRLCGKL